LKPRYFRPIATLADAEPLWPVHLLAFDAEAQERDQLQARVQVLNDELREAEARQAELDALRDAHEKLQRDHEAAVSDQQVRAKQAAEHEAKLQHELVEARQTASLSAKLQLLREADLRDLQARYQAVQQQQQQQHELLTKLAQRLSVATQYFEQLSIEQRHSGLVEHNDSTVA
jgi:chromosome segregation ATPase